MWFSAWVALTLLHFSKYFVRVRGRTFADSSHFAADETKYSRFGARTVVVSDQTKTICKFVITMSNVKTPEVSGKSRPSETEF